MDVVPSDFVVQAIAHLRQKPGHEGQVYHLCAGPEHSATLGALAGLAAEYFHVRAPFFVQPRLFVRARPLVDRFTWGRLRRILVAGRVYTPYLSLNLSFDTRDQRAGLAGSRNEVPRVKDYFANLFRFAIETDSGENPRAAAAATDRRRRRYTRGPMTYLRVALVCVVCGSCFKPQGKDTGGASESDATTEPATGTPTASAPTEALTTGSPTSDTVTTGSPGSETLTSGSPTSETLTSTIGETTGTASGVTTESVDTTDGESSGGSTGGGAVCGDSVVDEEGAVRQTATCWAETSARATARGRARMG